MFEMLKRIPATELNNQLKKLNEKERMIIYSVSDHLVNYIIGKYKVKISEHSSDEQKAKLCNAFSRLFEGNV